MRNASVVREIDVPGDGLTLDRETDGLGLGLGGGDFFLEIGGDGPRRLATLFIELLGFRAVGGDGCVERGERLGRRPPAFLRGFQDGLSHLSGPLK